MFARLLKRWSPWIAAAFCCYSAFLLWGLTGAQSRLKGVTELRLVADSQRRAAVISDFVSDRYSEVVEFAELPEISNYLANRALGMSPKYGLNSALDLVEIRFRALLQKKHGRDDLIYSYLGFFDEQSGLLVDVQDGNETRNRPEKSGTAASITLDEGRGEMVISAPVIYKETIAGLVTAVVPLSQVSRYLIASSESDRYGELLVMEGGTELRLPGRQSRTFPVDVKEIARIPAEKIAPVDVLSDAAPADNEGGKIRQVFAVRSPVKGIPLSVVTLFEEDAVYGQLIPTYFLYLAGSLPILVLAVLFVLERTRRRTQVLMDSVNATVQRSKALSDENSSLAREILRRERVEMELREKTSQLESMTESLRSSTRRAEDASRAKSDFLANMSHEIRTPLNGVLGMAQLLGMQDLSDDERVLYADTIFKSGQTLLGVLNDILDLSKIEAGKIELHNTPFEAQSLFNQARALFSERATEKGLEMQAGWNGAEGCQYLGDSMRLQQILNNLLSNAIKFTSRGRIELIGREVHRADGNALIEFRVTDTGVGVPKDKQGMLFKPFSQVDASLTRRFGGTGLGLSIVRNLVELMHGSVDLQSAEGQGTTVTVRVLVGIASTGEAEPKRDSHGEWEGVSPEVFAGARVLVVEDTFANRLVVEGFLKRLGIVFESAENGEEAFGRVCRSHFDLVLMDCQMPVMDGYEATRRIRKREASEKLERVPVIALTAGAFSEDRERCIDSGMDDFLAKPINFDQLAEILHKWRRVARNGR